MTRPGAHDPSQPDRRDWSTRPARHLVDDVRPALRSPSPVDLLMLASAVVEAATTAGSDAAEIDLDTFVGWLADVDGLRPQLPELVALASAMLPLVGRQPWLAATLVRVVQPQEPWSAEPPHPRWLERMREMSVARVVTVTTVPDAATTVVVEVHWPIGLDAVVTIAVGPAPDGLDEIRPGTPVVLDALAAPLPMAALLDHYRSSIPDATVESVSWADVSARVAAALLHGRLVDAALDRPATSTETWPLSRPFLNWLVDCPG